MSQQQVDLGGRARAINRAHLVGASMLAIVGVILMITIALMPLGLIVFGVAIVWFVAAVLIGKHGRETARDL